MSTEFTVTTDNISKLDWGIWCSSFSVFCSGVRIQLLVFLSNIMCSRPWCWSPHRLLLVCLFLLRMSQPQVLLPTHLCTIGPQCGSHLFVLGDTCCVLILCRPSNYLGGVSLPVQTPPLFSPAFFLSSLKSPSLGLFSKFEGVYFHTSVIGAIC